MARTREQRSVPVVLIAIAIALVAARVASLVIKPEAPKQVQWVTLEEAKTLASSGKPLMLYFTADWCPPCHQLEAEVFGNVDVARKINESVIPVKLVDRQREEGKNAPDVQTLQHIYRVDGFPIVEFVTPSGRSLARMEGFRGRNEFERLMENALR